MQNSFTLREMLPSDGPALVRLGEASPDTGRVGFHSVFPQDAYQTLLALHPSTIGVVAEAPDHIGIVGNGLVRFDEGYYEGELRPLAYLSSLHVHPDYRHRGIASAIADWRIQRARERFGAEGVIFAGIQADNEGSLATANKWVTQRMALRGLVGIDKVRTKPPQPIAGYEVRPARLEDYEQIAAKQNKFYDGYNLYKPQTADSLASWVSHAPFGLPVQRYHVATNSSGDIVAGLGTVAVGQLIPMHLTRMPLPLRLANIFLKLIPPGGVVRRILAVRFWFAEGHSEAARHLWETVRWLVRDQGTSIMIFLDSLNPVSQVIEFPPFGRQSGGSMALNAPVPISEDRPLDPYHFSW